MQTPVTQVLWWQHTLPVTEGDEGSKSKYLSVTRCFSYPHLRESSQQPQLWYHFVFKVNFEQGLLPLKIFLSVASSEALIQRCSLMKYGGFINEDLSEDFLFKIAVLIIFRKFLKKNIRHRAHITLAMSF